MQQREEGNVEVIGGPKGGRKSEVNEPGHWAGGNNYGRCVDERKIVKRCRVEDSREGHAVPSRQAASSKKELLPRVKGVRKAVEVVELSQDDVDKVDAKD
eukprot:5435804-Pleurochrysis_carterae.AAC.1